MQKQILLHISSLSGNTRKLAEDVEKELKKRGWDFQIRNSMNNRAINREKAGLHLLFFWCRKSGLDDCSMEVVKNYEGERFLAVGTMGSYPNSPYGKQVHHNVKEKINENNCCIDVFLCQGKIAAERTERRRNLPKDHPHYLNEEGYKRHLASRSHPDENDRKGAVDFVISHIISLTEQGRL